MPRQFDELVACATSRDPAGRFADAAEMGEELDAIAVQLGLPRFTVPSPRNSAMHQSASVVDAPTTNLAGPRHTRVMERDEAPALEPDDADGDSDFDDEHWPVTGRFAGIDLEEFYWARQRARRVLLFWVIAVLTLAALAGAGAWTLGTNLHNLL